MSHRTAAAALLIASLPYGLALPQVVPLVSKLAPNVTPSPLSLVSALDASSVTVIGTIVQPAVESAVEDVTDAVEDAIATIASALESATGAVEDVLPTDAPSILDPEANILPLILPGILPVETELPPLETQDAEPSDLPETNSLEVIDLPPPTEVPYGDDDLISEPFFPDFPDEATVPISTFNAVVQPLLTVIQTMLNSLPGNFATSLSGILPHPLLPTETPEIFIDPLLPTEALSDAAAATTTDAIDSLIDLLVDPIPINSIAKDLPFTKRQDAAGVDTNSMLAITTPILEAINDLIALIPGVGSAVSDAVSTVEPTVPELPFDVPALPIDALPLPIPDITLPNLALPSMTTPDVLPTDDLPVDIPVPALPKSPLTTPPALSDLTSALPEEILNVPIPDDVQGIDWAAFESPPFSDLPASSLDDVAIPEDILNVPVPNFDEGEAPIDVVSDVATAIPDIVTVISDAVTAISEALPTGLDDAVAGATAAVPATLPTSLDAFGDFPDDLLDWPFSDIPETLAPDINGELPDLEDFTIPDDVLNVPVPDLDDFGVPLDFPTDVAGLLLPNPAPTLALPTDLLTVATDLFDVPIPTDLLNVPVPAELADATVPTDFLDALIPADPLSAIIPADVLDAPIPTHLSDTSVLTDLLDVPVPTGLLDVPVPTDLLDVPVPTDWFDIPVPEGFEDISIPPDVAAALPAASTLGDEVDLPIPDDILNIPWPDLDENGVPIDLPVDPADNLAAPPATLPTDLNWWDIPVPDDWVDADDVASTLPAPAASKDVVSDVVPIPEVGEDSFKSPDVLDSIQSGLPVNLPAPALPTDAFGAGFPIQAFPDIPLVLPTVPDVASQLPAEDFLPNEGPAALTGAFTDVPTDAISGLPTSGLADVLPAAPAITGLPEALPTPPIAADTLAAAPPVAVPTIPAVAPPVVAPALPVVAPVRPAPELAAPAVAAPALPVAPAVKLPFQVPGTRGVVGKRQLSKSIPQPKPGSKPSLAATAENVDILNKVLIKMNEALSLVLPGGTKSLPKIVPTLPGVNPPSSSLPLPSLPVVATGIGGVGGVGGIVSSLPASDIAGIIPSLPAPIVADVIPTIVPDLGSLVDGAVPSLPEPDLPSILPALPGLSDVITPEAASILPAPATLPDVGGLASDIIPSLATPELSSILPAPAGLPELSSLTGGIAPATAAPDVVGVLPAPADLSDLGGITSIATDAVPGLPVVDNVASAVTGPVVGGVAVVPDAAGVASTISSTVPADLLSSLGGKLKKRSDTEALQLLSELDESKQSELAGLIYHSSDAVENNNVDAMAGVIKSDLENMSDYIKEALLKGVSASTIGKRSMRYAKRQGFTDVPGVQSIGPELDDATKINVSGFNLDPNNQLNGLAAPGKLVDSTSPPTFEEFDAPVASLADPELVSILASGGLDPNRMLSSPTDGTPVDDGFAEDPYADIRQNLKPSFVGSAPLEGLDATLQAAKNNHFSEKTPQLSWVPTAGGSAATQQQQQQVNVMQWFQRFVKPSWNKDVDAEVVR